MPIQEFRETLEQKAATVVSALGDPEREALIITKRIELEEGMRHTLMAVDFMDDSFILPSDKTLAYEAYLSPYPINLTQMFLAELFDFRGPLASDDSVLWKRTSLYIGAGGSQGVYTQQLPNSFLGSMPTYSWYTPTLYFTVVLHIPSSTGSTVTHTFDDLGMSFYAAVKSTKIESVEYLMGCMGEYQDAQTRSLMSQGVQIEKPIETYQGQTFPMWKYGGIRPERMIRGVPSFANFFLGYGDDSEQMIPTDQARIFIRGARKMNPYDTAFGINDPVKGEIPDWIRFGIDTSIAYGPLCSRYPPRGKEDNGNTKMFLASGL